MYSPPCPTCPLALGHPPPRVFQPRGQPPARRLAAGTQRCPQSLWGWLDFGLSQTRGLWARDHVPRRFPPAPGHSGGCGWPVGGRCLAADRQWPAAGHPHAAAHLWRKREKITSTGVNDQLTGGLVMSRTMSITCKRPYHAAADFYNIWRASLIN